MNQLTRLLIPAVALLAFGAVAVNATAANAQQDKMKTCNAQATSRALKGDERRTYMQSCLRAAPTAVPPATPQQRMKSCNVQANARALKGDDRKQFMSTCLKAR